MTRSPRGVLAGARVRARRRVLAAVGALGLTTSVVVPLAGAAAGTAAEEVLLGTAEDFGIEAEPAPRTTRTGAWFVELTGEPAVRGGSPAALAGTHEAFLDRADDLGVDVELRQEFTQLWNGLSVTVDDADVAALARVEDVVAVHPVVEVPAPGPAEVGPHGRGALGMTGADAAGGELDGSGVSVGIIGTGVDYDHPDLGGAGTDGETGFPTGRVTHGHDLVGDAYDADPSSDSYQPVPEPDEDPDDCAGHGTHVAGIVGAAGEVSGVAPAVTLGAYRVFGCSGSSDSDIVLAAMERAAADGMDVVNLSLSMPFMTWPDYPVAAAADALVDAGVVVVAPVGGAGEHGVWSAGAQGVSGGTIAVAAYERNQVLTDALRIEPDGRDVAFSAAGSAPAPPTSGAAPLVRAGANGSLSSLGCSPTEAADGAVLLVQRGTCTFYDKATAAQASGAAGLLVYNSEPGLFSPTVAGPTAVSIPVVALSLEDGLAISGLLAQDDVDVVWTDEQIEAANPQGGLVSATSSAGLTADLRLKPDVGAPGGDIYSLYPVEQGGYATGSGAATASPHVAGAVALMLQDSPGLTAEQVLARLQSTADPSLWSLSPAAGLLEPVQRQGAGLVDVDDAITATTTVTPSALSLGEGAAGPATETLTLTSTAGADATYRLSAVHSVATAGPTAAPSFYYDPARVDLPAEVTVPAGGTATVEVTVHQPANVDLAQYGGYLVLSPDEGEPLRVPFAGFAGDYQQLPALTDPFDAGVPALAVLTGCDRLLGVSCVDPEASWEPAEEGAVYSMADGDVPTVLLHLEHPAERLSFTVHEAAADGSAGRPVGSGEHLAREHLGRDGAAFRAWTWDGTPGSGAEVVPDGDYVLEVTVLRALGDPDDAEHVETWTTPAFSIDRDGDGNPARSVGLGTTSPRGTAG